MVIRVRVGEEIEVEGRRFILTEFHRHYSLPDSVVFKARSEFEELNRHKTEHSDNCDVCQPKHQVPAFHFGAMEDSFALCRDRDGIRTMSLNRVTCQACSAILRNRRSAHE